MRHALLTLSAVVLLAPAARAQRQAAPFPTRPAPLLLAPRRAGVSPLANPDNNRDALRLVMGGLGLGVVGVFLGGYAGARIEENGGCAYDDFCGLAGAVVGATVGETILLPAGVHLANDQRGSYALDVGAAALAGLGGWILTFATNDGTFLLAIPAGQLIAAVLVERRSGRGSRAP